MNKEQLFENLDFQEDDRIYIIKLRKIIIDGVERVQEQRINYKFNIYELLGIAKRMERDMYKFFERNSIPEVDITERIILKDENH